MNDETKLACGLVAVALVGVSLIVVGAGLLNAKLAAVLSGFALVSIAGTMLAAILNQRK